MKPFLLLAAVAAVATSSPARAADPGQPLTFRSAKDAAGRTVDPKAGHLTPPPKVHEMHAELGPDGRVRLDCDGKPNPEFDAVRRAREQSRQERQ